MPQPQPYRALHTGSRNKRRVTYGPLYATRIQEWKRDYQNKRNALAWNAFIKQAKKHDKHKHKHKHKHVSTPPSSSSSSSSSSSHATQNTHVPSEGSDAWKRLYLKVCAEAAVQERPTRVREEHGQFHVSWDDLGLAALRAHCEMLTFTPYNPSQERRNARLPKFKQIPPKQYKAYRLHAATRTLSVPAWYGRALWGCATDVCSTEGTPLWPETIPQDKRQQQFPLYDKRYKRQQDAKRNVIEFWKRHARGGAASCTLVMPCGAGKTFTAISTAVAMGRRVCILVHKEELMEQMERSARTLFPFLRVGIVQTKQNVEVDPTLYDVVICMIPTLSAWIKRDGMQGARKKLRAETFGVLVGDEAHHMAAEQFMKVRQLFNARYQLWLTATPEREDRLVRELEWLTGPTVFKGEKKPGTLRCAVVQFPAWNRAMHSGRDGTVNYAQMQYDSATDPSRNAWAVELIGHLLDEGRTVLVNCARAGVQAEQLARLVVESRKDKHDWRHTQPPFFNLREVARKRRAAFKRAQKKNVPFDEEPYRNVPESMPEQDGPLVSVVMSSSSVCDKDAYRELNHVPGVVANLSNEKSTKARKQKWAVRHSRVLIAHFSQYCDGFDMPLCDTALFLGSVKAEAATIQGVERIARDLPGKKTPWVIDVADAMSPATNSTSSRMFLNIQRRRKTIFKSQQYTVVSASVANKDSKMGTCPVEWWSQVKRQCPPTRRTNTTIERFECFCPPMTTQ